MGGIAYVPKHEYEAMKAEIERLRAAANAVIGNAGAIEGDAMHVRVSRHLIGSLRAAVEPAVADKTDGQT